MMKRNLKVKNTRELILARLLNEKKNALRDRDESDDVDKFAAKQKYFWDLEIKVYS